MWVPGFRPKTGFQLWLEENRKSITAGQPDLEEMDVIKEAMGRFRVLSAEERLVTHTFTSVWAQKKCWSAVSCSHGGFSGSFCS